MERIVRRGDMAAKIKQFNKTANEEYQHRLKYEYERRGIDALKR